MVVSPPTDTSPAEQCLVEHRTLSHVKAALRLALDWQAGTAGLTRKMSTVKFTAHSFRRHLFRLMELEEDGGYMIVVGEMKPNLVEKVWTLRSEHDEFRSALDNLLPSIETVSEYVAFEERCSELRALLARIDAHDEQETELLQEAVLTDDGGEG